VSVCLGYWNDWVSVNQSPKLDFVARVSAFFAGMHVDPKVGSILEAFENIDPRVPRHALDLNARLDLADTCTIFPKRVEYPI
jgi:hypothetical protein